MHGVRAALLIATAAWLAGGCGGGYGDGGNGNGNGMTSPDPGVVEGTVVEEGEAPLSGVTVRLRDAGSTTDIATRQTDTDGDYRFTDVDPGEYDVRIDVPAGRALNGGSNPTRVTVNEGGTARADFTLALAPVSFANFVEPVFAQMCGALDACHAGSSPQENLSLEAGQAYDEIVNVPSVQVPDMDRIEPGEPDQSYLIHKIQGTQDEVGGGGFIMPEGGPRMPQETIDLIRRWVAEGAADN